MAQAIQIESEERDFETRDVRLASALMAVGVRPLGDLPVYGVVRTHLSGQDRKWLFEPRSACGRWVTRELCSAWREGLDWVESHPDHPFAYIMAGMMNLQANVKLLKEAEPFAVVRKGKQFAMLPTNASAELERKVLGRMK